VPTQKTHIHNKIVFTSDQTRSIHILANSGHDITKRRHFI